MQTDSGGALIPLDEFAIAQGLWQRFRFYCDNGHTAYVARNRRNYRYFMGDGGQWADADREYMESVQGRKCFEINLSKQAVLTAVGEQIATRTDLAYKPKKNGASEQTAQDLTKIGMHVLDENNFHAKETNVWESGLIAERGYYDVRMDFAGNVHGEIVIDDLDPVTVIPDIFATSYEPDKWPGFIRFQWLSLDEIQATYGKEARQKAEQDYRSYSDRSFNEEFPVDNLSDLNYGFSSGPQNFYQWFDKDTGEVRLRVIERQYYRNDLCLFYVNPRTGDREMVPADKKLSEAMAFAEQNSLVLQRAEARRIRWCAATAVTLLFDEWSPYKTFTVIPFFYLFHKGQTGCMMTDAISPQDLLNKSVSATVHYLTSLSNSGWIVQKGKVVNMTTAELEKVGMKTGLVLEVDGPIGDCLQKIQPNTFPTGMDRMSDRGENWIKGSTGMSDAEQGLNSPDESGIALAMRTFQSKLQLARPLSNLDLTKTLLGRKVIELAQQFYTNERIFMITGTDGSGKQKAETMVINRVDPSGAILNDITVGEYEVAVSVQPAAATYEESQFKQIQIMRKDMNVAIPDDEVIRRSNLQNKNELADRIANPQDTGAAAAQAAMLDKQLEELTAKVELLKAQRNEVVSKTANTNVQALYGAVNTGKVIAMIPGVAPLADQLAASAGFEDHDTPPVIPQQVPGIAADAMRGVKGTPFVPGVAANTSPNFPPIAEHGVTAGIEGGHA